MAEKRFVDEASRSSPALQSIGFFSATDGVIREANDACLAILGHTRAELEAGELTRDFLVPPHLVRQVADGRAEAERSGAVRFEIDYVRPDKTRIALLVGLARLESRLHVGMIFDLSVQRGIETALGKSEARFRAAAEGFDAFVIFRAARRADGRIADFVYVDLNSHALERIGRSSREEVIGKKLTEIVPQPQVSAYVDKYARVVESQQAIEEEVHVEVPGLKPRWVALHVVPLEDGVAVTSRDISVDITGIKRAEESLKGFEILFRRSPLGILISAVDGTIVDSNESALRLLGYARDELVGRSSGELGLLPPDQSEKTFEAIRTQGFVRDLVLEIRVKSGELRDVMISVERVELSTEARFITTFLDVSALKRAEKALRESSLVDELTGLHNRRGFFALAGHQMKTSRRPGGPGLALLFIDLDGLKNVNDTRGHAAGDELLRDAGRFLRRTFRESDIVARLGGDEFVVLAACHPGRAGELLARMQESLQSHNVSRPAAHPLAMSVGLSILEPDATLEEVLMDADRKMYVAKSAARRGR